MAKADRTITVGDRTQSLSAWAQETGIPHRTICQRLARGWDAVRAVTEKPDAGASARGRKAVKKRESGRKRGTVRSAPLPDLDTLPDHLEIKRTLNADALTAVQQLARPDSFFDCYQLLYRQGAMTGGELDEKHRLFGGQLSQKMHSHLSVLEQLGLVKVVGRRRCAITGRRCGVWDVTDVVPVREITWTAVRREEALLPARNGHDRVVPSSGQLRAGIGEFQRMAGIMKRMGKPFLEATCDVTLRFIEQEAKRYETLIQSPGPVLRLVADE